MCRVKTWMFCWTLVERVAKTSGPSHVMSQVHSFSTGQGTYVTAWRNYHDIKYGPLTMNVHLRNDKYAQKWERFLQYSTVKYLAKRGSAAHLATLPIGQMLQWRWFVVADWPARNQLVVPHPLGREDTWQDWQSAGKGRKSANDQSGVTLSVERAQERPRPEEFSTRSKATATFN